MQTDEFIAQINEITGLALAPDSDSAVAFTYQNRNVLLRFVEEQGVCLVFTEIGRLEPAALPGALVDLMEANHLLSDTQGGALSFQRQSGMVSLNFLMPCEGPNAADAFVSRLNRALTVSDEWAQRIREINAKAIESVESTIRDLQEHGGSTGEPLSFESMSFGMAL
jgi:hypothetical protein